ncbi:50S ribosomal protein L4 [bacterium]|nr:50S ribosomal protein L4 [bacterium]
MAKIDVYNKEGKVVKQIDIHDDLVTGRVNKDVLYYYIKMYNANQRQGTACTKTRKDIAGSTIKPWKQKGTGSARAGTKKSPVWRGGGTVFGPLPRDYRQDLPKKVKKAALISAIKTKFPEKDLIVMDELSFPAAKTKDMVSLLNNLKITDKVLLATSGKSENIYKSGRNIQKVFVKECDLINAYDVLNYKKLIITEKGIKSLEKKLFDKEKTVEKEPKIEKKQ